MNECALFEPSTDGGGNLLPGPGGTVIVRRNAAIGDVLVATIVAERLVRMGRDCRFQSHPATWPVLRRAPYVKSFGGTEGSCHVNLDRCYEDHPQRRVRHFHQLFMAAAQRQLQGMGLDLGTHHNCKPVLAVSPQERAIALAKFNDFPRPWLFICPRSQTYRVRTVQDGVWREVADALPGTKFWLGLYPSPPGITDLQCRHLDNLICWLSAADLLLTVDTGPMHLAVAQGIPAVVVGQSSSPHLHLSDQRDWCSVEPPGLACLNCQLNLCPKDADLPPCQNIPPAFISSEAKARLSGAGRVSAVIPIFKPSAEMLNRCLDAVLPQVDEVILTGERGARVPEGFRRHEKILTCSSPQSELGFGRNVNFGVRHSHNELLLILNDDVYLEHDAVDQMSACLKPDTGIVGMLTRYPDGTIYHAGKPRAPGGAIGHPHLNHRQHLPDITEPREMENTNGAAILVRRKAFYDAGGFDENFMFYAEDDDLCMKIRQAGWRLWYTPLATGVHDEHAETRHRPDMMKIMAQSNAYYGKKWGWYFNLNRNNPGLGVFK